MLKWLITLLCGVAAAAPPTASYTPRVLPKLPPSGRIALVVGHNPAAQGAIRITDRRTEFDWNGALAERIAAPDPGRYVIIRRTAGPNEIARAYADVERAGVRASVELHFNSSAASSATGTETLISATFKSKRFAALTQAEMVAALGLRDRGLKQPGPKDGGYTALKAASPPAILIGPYFGSNAADCAAADRNLPALAVGMPLVRHLRWISQYRRPAGEAHLVKREIAQRLDPVADHAVLRRRATITLPAKAVELLREDLHFNRHHGFVLRQVRRSERCSQGQNQAGVRASGRLPGCDAKPCGCHSCPP